MRQHVLVDAPLARVEGLNLRAMWLADSRPDCGLPRSRKRNKGGKSDQY
jgi:hypothetical protein